METIRKLALRRFLLLGLGLLAGLSVGVYEYLKGELPPIYFGIILFLLTIAFLAGLSLILRAAGRQIRRHLSQAEPSSTPAVEADSYSVLTLLRNKSR